MMCAYLAIEARVIVRIVRVDAHSGASRVTDNSLVERHHDQVLVLQRADVSRCGAIASMSARKTKPETQCETRE
jgi:hypothetical protein